ncbi:unnamed protein product [Albugo candida]|uniref:J domain-containing protein n=1 Tax=Albugo candida TaxID=65357 RepID=A0A024GSB6_9STRA|nr:unnamed protein product [Albugo candida]|eukprot:CCI49417.1 unnamed protein product [Albugo candida]
MFLTYPLDDWSHHLDYTNHKWQIILCGSKKQGTQTIFSIYSTLTTFTNRLETSRNNQESSDVDTLANQEPFDVDTLVITGEIGSTGFRTNSNFYGYITASSKRVLPIFEDLQFRLAFRMLPISFLTEEEHETINKKFQLIAEAYEILSDEEKRERYDRGEDVTGNQQEQHHPFGRGNPFGGSHVFQQGGQTFHFAFN